MTSFVTLQLSFDASSKYANDAKHVGAIRGALAAGLPTRRRTATRGVCQIQHFVPRVVIPPERGRKLRNGLCELVRRSRGGLCYEAFEVVADRKEIIQ